MTSAQVRRLGFATLKGTRHLARQTVTLSADGPVGDRAFCLVDVESARVLRTVEHPSLTRVEATETAGDLRLRWDDGREVMGRPEPTDARFRATITLDTERDAAPGSRWRVGSAVVEVQRRIDRCAVVDVDPASGRRDVPVLAHLERQDGLLTFGVDARVLQPGRVEVGDPALLEDPPH